LFGREFSDSWVTWNASGFWINSSTYISGLLSFFNIEI
jgi:hypothetical protein